MHRSELKVAKRYRIAAIIALNLIGTPLLRAAAATTGIVPGEQRRWALEFRTRLEQPGQKRPVEVVLTGKWTSTIVAMRSGEYDAALEFADVHLTGNAGGDVPPEAVEQAQRGLSRPFWATYRSDGALLAIHFFKDTDPGDRNLLQMIAAEAQFVRPDTSKMVWNALERDGGGSYLAIYNWAEPGAVVKRKLKYVHTDAQGAPPDGLHLDVEQSELRFTLDPDGGINTLEGSERVRMGGSRGDTGKLVVMTETRLTNLQRGKEPRLIGSLARAGSHVVSSPIVTHKSDPETARARLDGQLLEGHTTDSLLEAATTNVSKDRDLSERLAALFRRRPKAIPAALALLRQSGPQKRITYALGAAHTDAAVEALTNLAQDRATSVPVRIDALTALALVQHPSLAAMRIPFALLDDEDAQVASAARLMGGTLARAGRNEHRAEAEAIDAALIARYRKAQGADELAELLAALGNSAGPSVLPVIEQALTDARVPVRAAAARGLRLAEAPEIDGLLAATITGDQDPQVRAAAIFAASFRRPSATLGESLEQAAKGDSAVSVRSGAISLLRQHPNAAPGIGETLAWVAEHDAKPGVRRQAQEALASVSGQR